jgi:amidase
MATLDDLAFLDATAQAGLVRAKEVKPIELVEAAIERIDHLNPTLNAVILRMYDYAREAAAGELQNGPFAGVPFLLKDIFAFFAGHRVTHGSKLMQNFVPDHDSELVARLKRAGLIILGRTNVPEFGILPTTEPHFYGPCKNPWDSSRTTGGSSGGSAAAVAAGMVPMAHANDGGGSIRIPASCCGVFGLKPTRARNPLGPDFGDILSGTIVEHAVTRSVRDSAALLDATAGPDVGDPYWAPPLTRPFLQEVGQDPGKLHIAYSTKPINDAPLHTDCIRAIENTAKLCADLGHEVEESAPAIFVEPLANAFLVLYSAGCALSVKLLGGSRELVEPLTWALHEMGNRHSSTDYLLALQTLQAMSRQVARFFLNYDILLTPTLSEPPVPLGTFDSPPDNPLAGLYRAMEFVGITPLCNITGQPAMSVPLFRNDDNLPLGSHFIGRFGEEATLFRLAAQLEAAHPWAERRPPVSV